MVPTQVEVGGPRYRERVFALERQGSEVRALETGTEEGRGLARFGDLARVRRRG